MLVMNDDEEEEEDDIWRTMLRKCVRACVRLARPAGPHTMHTYCVRARARVWSATQHTQAAAGVAREAAEARAQGERSLRQQVMTGGRAGLRR
jgi:hypothetical protein